MKRNPLLRALNSALPEAGIQSMGLLDQVVVSAANFGAVLILARASSSAELGTYTLGLTVVLLLVAVHEALVGAPYIVYANRKSLQGEELHRYTGSCLVQATALGALASLTMLAVFGLSRVGVLPARIGTVVFMLSFVAGPAILRDFARRFALAHSRMRLLLLVDVLVSAIQLGLLAAFAVRGALGAASAFAALAIASTAASLTWLVAIRAEIRLDGAALRRHVAEGWSFGRWVLACSVTTVFHGYSVHWVLAAVAGTAATGLFEIVRSTANLINPLITGLRNVIGPLAARNLTTDGAAGVRRIVTQSTAFLLLVGVTFIGFMTIFGDLFIGFAFGAGYTGLAVPLVVTAAALVVNGLGVPSDQGLWAIERPDLNAKASAAGFLVTLVLALILIPASGILGGALSLLVGKVLETAAKIISLRLCLSHVRRPGRPLESTAA